MQTPTYLGHVHIAATQHYLTMTPELLREARLHFERFAAGRNGIQDGMMLAMFKCANDVDEGRSNRDIRRPVIDFYIVALDRDQRNDVAGHCSEPKPFSILRQSIQSGTTAPSQSNCAGKPELAVSSLALSGIAFVAWRFYVVTRRYKFNP